MTTRICLLGGVAFIALLLLAWAWRSPDIGEWRPDQDWTDEQLRALRVAGVL